METPWNLAPCDLSHFIKELRPTKSATKEVNDAIESLVGYMKKKLTVTVGRVGVAGEWGKSLSTQDDIFIDLLLYITDFRAIEDHSKRLPSIVNELRECLNDKYRLGMKNAQDCLTVYLPTCDDMITCTVFPTVDLLGNNPTQGTSSVYSMRHNIIIAILFSLANIGTFYRKFITVSDRSPYNATILEMQSNLIKKTPVYLHDLIRLVKVWQTTKLSLRSREPKPELFDLVTLHRWCKAGCPSEFDIRKGFFDVMKTLGDWASLQVIWGGTQYGRYDKNIMEEVAKHNLHICLEDTPLVMDPIDPFLNYCSGVRRLIWEEIERTARETTKEAVLKGGEVTPNWQ
ncbi:2'-5'-oligoadenylate synthase 3-like [Antedon mediterranea]|uniref:2'-5'-oligoadenylate synthase 3-like n=1 Tax=Antedon mediterranea TaxID=105859 RepID=UPI003AF6340E